MEKIQIQSSESDYNTYHDYCLKYFQVHDTTRRQSIHTFLDLYEKGMLTVGEEDINPARQALAAKCDELKNVQRTAAGGGDPATLPYLRLCSDLLLFVDDLEKMFRLLRKQGIVPNYLMILGTFAQVIAEIRDTPASGLYHLDPGLIGSLADPLAGIIRLRLGTDRKWQSVVKELAFIAARYNQKFTEPAFDRDIAQLVAPAVVAHFNRDVPSRDILAAMSSSFEESELDEFESLLNRTPEALKIDQEGEIEWDSISGPLKEAAAAIAAQREQLAQGALKIADPALLVMTPGGPASTGAVQPSAPVSVAPASRSFDMMIGPGVPARGEAPVKAAQVAEEPPATPATQSLKPFFPVMIGIGIIVLFIVGTMFLSGGWNPMGNTTNSSKVTMKNVTVTKTTVKPTATKPAANVTTTTAKPAANTTTVKVTATATPTPKTYSSTDIANHLLDIAFGPDNSKIVKPTKDLVSISLSGSYSDSDVDHLKTFTDHFNIYTASTKISTNLNLNGQGDIPVVFISQEGLTQINTNTKTGEYRDINTGDYYLVTTDEKIYLNAELSGSARKRWLLRGVLIKMGFYGDSAKYPESLFYSDSNNVAEPNTLDWKAIQLMYGKKITNGMTKPTVRSVLGV